MRIGITFNLKDDLPVSWDGTYPEDAAEEFDLPGTIEAIQGVLEEAGHDVFPLGGNLGILEKIRRERIEFVFNLAEGFRGRNREAHVPSLLEMMDIPYSGSDPLGLSVTLDKSVMKRFALSLGIQTPDFWIVERGKVEEAIPDRFPLFVKPLWEGSSKGVRLTSKVTDRLQLETELERIHKDYPEDPVLVEAHIPGREFTVGVVGNGRPEILGVMEISFRDARRTDFCYSLEVKRNWKEQVDYHVPPRLDPVQEVALGEAAARLFGALRLRDVARFDFRMDRDGKFYFLEANPLPGLSPESGDLVILAQKKGWSYGRLILKIMRSAVSRYPSLKPRLAKCEND